MKETVKMILKRGAVSFALSAIIGLLVNLIVDLIVNSAGNTGFISMPPEARALFPTPAIAAYVNVLLYGAIGATFAMMTFLFEIDRLGFLIQSILYFILTAMVLAGITVFLWQLHRHPQALIPTLAGYAVTYFIMFITQYRQLKKNIREINQDLMSAEG